MRVPGEPVRYVVGAGLPETTFLVVAECIDKLCIHTSTAYFVDEIDDPSMAGRAVVDGPSLGVPGRGWYRLGMKGKGLRVVPFDGDLPSAAGSPTFLQYVQPSVSPFVIDALNGICYALHVELLEYERAARSGQRARVGQSDNIVGVYTNRGDGDCSRIYLYYAEDRAGVSRIRWGGPLGKTDPQGKVYGTSCATFVVVIFRSVMVAYRGDALTDQDLDTIINPLLEYREWRERDEPVIPCHVLAAACLCRPDSPAPYDKVIADQRWHS